MECNPLSEVNVIVAVGSIDGMAATAACIRHFGNPNIHVVFTQAFQVNRVKVFQWPVNSKVGIIDLAVNNQGSKPNPQMTIEFVNRIYDQGHKIQFIADEHDKQAWNEVLVACNLRRKDLLIRPKNREKYSSSSNILLKTFGEHADTHTKGLLYAGDQGDQMNFDTPFGRIFNEGIKSDMNSIERRLYMVRHLATSDIPDELIQRWMDEYALIKSNQPKVLATRQDLGDGISRYDGTVGPHDATVIIKEAYKTSPVVIMMGSCDGTSSPWASICTNNKNLNLLSIVQEAGISSSGMAGKVNLAVENLQPAIEAIRTALRIL